MADLDSMELGDFDDLDKPSSSEPVKVVPITSAASGATPAANPALSSTGGKERRKSAAPAITADMLEKIPSVSDLKTDLGAKPAPASTALSSDSKVADTTEASVNLAPSGSTVSTQPTA